MTYYASRSTPSVPQRTSADLPSPFLASDPFANPPAPLKPADPYGAKLRVTLSNVNKEVGSMRSDLEGILNLRDELDSVRTELELVKKLVDAQGERIETRVLGAVSTLFDSKLGPLFDAVLESAKALSTSFQVSDSNSSSRARAQNARIEEVEASNRRSLDQVKDHLASETNSIRPDTASELRKLEAKIQDTIQEGLHRCNASIARQVEAKVTNAIHIARLEVSDPMMTVDVETRKRAALQGESSGHTQADIEHHRPVPCHEERPPLHRSSSPHQPLRGADDKGPSSCRSILNQERPKSLVPEPSDNSPPSPPQRRHRPRGQLSSFEWSRGVARQPPSSLAGTTDNVPEGDVRDDVTSTKETSSGSGGYFELGPRSARRRRVIEQDLSQNREGAATRTGLKRARACSEEDDEVEETEPDTIEWGDGTGLAGKTSVLIEKNVGF